MERTVLLAVWLVIKYQQLFKIEKGGMVAGR
jgi:hypothetical protein